MCTKKKALKKNQAVWVNVTLGGDERDGNGDDMTARRRRRRRKSRLFVLTAFTSKVLSVCVSILAAFVAKCQCCMFDGFYLKINWNLSQHLSACCCQVITHTLGTHLWNCISRCRPVLNERACRWWQTHNSCNQRVNFAYDPGIGSIHDVVCRTKTILANFKGSS